MIDRPDLEISYGDPRELVDYERNTRTHSAEQIAAIRRSIEAFGFTNPILLKDDGRTIGAGHARRAAALLDPPLARVPYIILPGLTDAEWRAYVIADNKLSEQGSGWDERLLKLEMADLKALDLDLTLTGFGQAELDELLRPPAPPVAPSEFPAYGEGVSIQYCCPKCSYKWSGNPNASAKA